MSVHVFLAEVSWEPLWKVPMTEWTLLSAWSVVPISAGSCCSKSFLMSAWSSFFELQWCLSSECNVISFLVFLPFHWKVQVSSVVRLQQIWEPSFIISSETVNFLRWYRTHIFTAYRWIAVSKDCVFTSFACEIEKTQTELNFPGTSWFWRLLPENLHLSETKN